MNVPSVNDLVSYTSRELFSEARFPYIYACDFLRTHPEVLPMAVSENFPDMAWGNMSRSEARRVRIYWAECLNVPDQTLANLLAEAFIIINNIRR